MSFSKILEETLSSLLGCKISVEIKEDIVDVYVTGIGGCKFSLQNNRNEKVKLIQCDISQQFVDNIIQGIKCVLDTWRKTHGAKQ